MYSGIKKARHTCRAILRQLIFVKVFDTPSEVIFGAHHFATYNAIFEDFQTFFVFLAKKKMHASVV